MYLPLPPVDFQARYALRVQSSVPQPSFNTVAYSIDDGSGVRRASELFSTCLAQLEQTRDMALKVQDDIQLLWTTLIHNSSPARSMLPHLSLNLYSGSTFRCLQRFVNDFDISIASWMARNLKPEYPEMWGFHRVAAVVSHEQEYMKRFCHKWEKLVACLQHRPLAEALWSKEVYDLLETAFRNLQQLQSHLGDIHYDIHMFLRPREAAEIQCAKLASGALSAGVELPRQETRSILQRRGYGVAEGADKTSNFQDDCYLLNEMSKTK